ncbi:response regulator [Brachybacterium hainanense]|uniref:Response regulator n=1 Tax=Brachybacterium hainanense TaxID=1541174 RepID=A0ABV6R9Z8_9MICO
MITIGLADDEPLFTAGLSMILDSQGDMSVLWEAVDGADAVRRHDRRAPGILLLDIQMPGLDGLAATRQLVAASTSSRIIILTTFDTDEHVLAAVEAGAAGFLVKNTPPEELLAAIRTVHAGDAVISPGPTRRLFASLRRAAPPGTPTAAAGMPTEAAGAPAGARDGVDLTPRERDILALVARGRSNQEICEDLWLSMPTVKTHIGNLLAKTGSRDRVHLVLFALRTGAATLEDALETRRAD